MPRKQLENELRDMLFRVIPIDYRGGGQTQGHLYQHWLIHGGPGGDRRSTIIIDYLLDLMLTLGFHVEVLRVVREWNSTYAPITRATRNSDVKNQRIVLATSHHAEALARSLHPKDGRYGASKTTTQAYTTNAAGTTTRKRAAARSDHAATPTNAAGGSGAAT